MWVKIMLEGCGLSMSSRSSLQDSWAIDNYLPYETITRLTLSWKLSNLPINVSMVVVFKH